jgi:hypothetical protein
MAAILKQNGRRARNIQKTHPPVISDIRAKFRQNRTNAFRVTAQKTISPITTDMANFAQSQDGRRVLPEKNFAFRRKTQSGPIRPLSFDTSYGSVPLSSPENEWLIVGM